MKREEKPVITRLNDLDPWAYAEAMAMIASKRFGCIVTITDVKNKFTGESYPRRDRRNQQNP